MMRTLLALFIFGSTLTTSAGAQTQVQSLPRGLDTTEANSSTSFPFASGSSHVWQWHYDSTEFDAVGPIRISEIYVRSKSTSPAMTFDFPSVEITLASSPTDYSINGDGFSPGHSTTFANNLNPDAKVVKSSTPFTGTSVLPQEWAPLGLDSDFVYDPTLGQDFVLEIRSCGAVQIWPAGSVDGQSGPSNLNGGNRYGVTSNCVATASTTQNDEFVPVILIEYTMPNPNPSLWIGPMSVGQLADFELFNIDPGGLVRILWSTAGAGPTNTPLGPVELTPPLQVSLEVYADLTGALVFSTFVPAGLAGTTFYCQAAATKDGNFELTNAVSVVVN